MTTMQSAPTPVLTAARKRTRRVLVPVRWPVGGIRTHVVYNYPHAIEQGYRFTFVGPDDSTFDTFAKSLSELPEAEYVPVRFSQSRRSAVSEIRRLLDEQRFDLIHSHGLTAGALTSIANRRHRVPHIVTMHDPLRVDQFRGWIGRGKRWYLGMLLSRVDATICVSNDIRQNLFEYLPTMRDRRIDVIPNGITLRSQWDEPPAIRSLRNTLGIARDVALFGFLGRFMEQKGFLELLRALQKLKSDGTPRSWHLVAVGSGDYEREYRAELIRLGLGANVTIQPFVSDVTSILRQLDLLIVPSLWEASSLVSMEAMIEGIPVLGTDCIGLREVLRDTPSPTCKSGDSADLANHLRQFLVKPWTTQARAFAPEARRRFDNLPSVRRLIALFNELELVRS